MGPSRIAELIHPFLAPEGNTADIERLTRNISTYIDILLRWNARINLTAVRDPEKIVTRHFGESLFAARHLFPSTECEREGHDFSRADARGKEGRALAPEAPDTGEDDGGRSGGQSDRGTAALQGRVNGERKTGASAPAVADIGSGAGFPGIPIKLWSPQVSLTLIESNHKKATFLREVVHALTLTDVNVQNARAQSLTGTLFDVVTLRAVERFDQVLPTAAHLVALAGRLALLIGQSQVSRVQSLLPSFSWAPPIQIPASQSRVLSVGLRPLPGSKQPSSPDGVPEQ